MSTQPDRTASSGRVFVTGGSGHLGANLVRRLLVDGWEVRALAKPGDNNEGLHGLDLERAQGDLRDYEAIKRHTKGCTRIYHVGAKVSTLNATAGEQKDLYDINVIGTRNIMRAALRNDVERVVLSGSFSAVGYDPADPSAPSHEDMPFYPFGKTMPYAHTKALAELEMLKAVADGLDAVIATSCAVVGPHDYFPSRLGRTLCDYCTGQLRAYIPGGFPFVAARDIVEGHVLAMEKGRRGHKYIFATEFQTLDDLLSHFEAVAGGQRPKIRIPGGVMAAVTGVYSGVVARYIKNLPQRLTPGTINILRLRRRADTTKARAELGWRPTSIRDAITAAYDHFVERGVIRPRRSANQAPAPAE